MLLSVEVSVEYMRPQSSQRIDWSEKSMALMAPQQVDVDILVAGGGPAGLAAACAIHRATDYSVKVVLWHRSCTHSL